MRPPRALAAYFFFHKAAFAYLIVLFTSLFLNEYGASGLPWYYVGQTLLFILSQLAIMRWTTWKGKTILSGLLPGLCVITLMLAAIAGQLPAWVIFFTLVLAKTGETHANQAFYDVSGQILPVRDSKRSLPGIMAAGTVGSVLAGLSLRFIMTEGTLAWFLVVAAVAFLLAGHLLPKPNSTNSGTQSSDSGKHDATGALSVEKTASVSETALAGLPFSTRRYVTVVLIMSATGTLTCGLVDFLFSGRLALEFQDSHQIATFLGLFNAMVDLTVLCIQGLFGGWFFRRLPLSVILSVRPVLLCATCLAAWWHPVFALAAISQFFMRTSTSIFMSPSWVLLLEPLPAGPRVRARRMLNIIDSATTLCVGLSLLAWTKSGGGADHGLYLLDAVLYAASMLLTGLLVKLYPLMIQDTLADAPAAEKSEAVAGVRFLPRRERLLHLQKLLHAKEAGVRGYAIRECAKELDEEMLDILLTVIASEDHGPNLTMIVRAVMAQCGDTAGPVLVELLDQGQDPRLLADLLEAIGRSDFPGLEQVSAQFLNFPHRRVRGAAALNMLRHGHSREVLQKTIACLHDDVHSSDPATRATVAVVLGRAGLPIFLPALMRLADDHDDMVAGKALRVLADFSQPRVLEFLMEHTTLPGARGVAAAEAFKKAASVERSSMLQLLHGLSENDRRRLGFWWQILGAGLDPLLLQRLLRVENGARREALLQTLADSGPAIAATMSACLHDENGHTILRSNALWEMLSANDWAELPTSAALISAVCEPADKAGAKLLLKRTVDMAHTAWLIALAYPHQKRADVAPNWHRRFEVLLKILAIWGGDSGAWHDALEKARAMDRFMISVAQEFLEARLGNQFARVLLPLLDPQGSPDNIRDGLLQFGIAGEILSVDEAKHLLVRSSAMSDLADKALAIDNL